MTPVGAATQPCTLFDDRGERWDARSGQLAAKLNASIAGEELAAYAIKNLGFIAVASTTGSLRIRMRPQVVSPVAFSAFLYWLYDQTAIERVLLSFLGESWSHELVPSREEAVRRLVESVSFTTPERAGDFLNLQRSPHELAPSSPLRALLDAWSECAGQYDRGRLDRLLREALKGRFVLFEANAGAPYVQVKDVGDGLSMSASYWLSRTKGLRVEDQPDYAYGKWLRSPIARCCEPASPASRTSTPSFNGRSSRA